MDDMLKRRTIQLLIGLSIYVMVAYYSISLVYLLLFGGLLGIIFGNVFCRWMCPIGYIIESMMKLSKNNEMAASYQYRKIGCPISWINGYFNRMSLFKIKIDHGKCIDCGKCDDVCYITNLNKEYSLYNEGKSDPAVHPKCSKCMDCITVCPTDSLTFSK
ncbi:MAG: 4Fe-4S binding protein [Methanosarcinaceae archaeon]|nr:4Fe-4S binding protein [Methanosarcinaceae archaeon]